MSKFKTYINQLEALDTKNTLLKYPKMVLFISGSNFYHTASLSTPQITLLEALSQNGFVAIKSNFPYHMDFHHDGVAPYATMAQATKSNCIYYYHTLYNKRFHQQLVKHMTPLENAREVVFIAKSSGLNVLTQLLKRLPLSKTKLTIIALGPVSKEQFQTLNTPHRLIVLKGNQDHYSKVLDRHVADYDVSCNHFDYEVDDTVRNIICRLVHG